MRRKNGTGQLYQSHGAWFLRYRIGGKRTCSRLAPLSTPVCEVEKLAEQIMSAPRKFREIQKNGNVVRVHKNIARRGKNVHELVISYKTRKLQAQGGRCAICKTDDPGPRGWQYDHCHDEQGEYRDVLCRDCNVVLGLVKENEETLLEMVLYVRKHRKTTPLVAEALSLPEVIG